MEKTIEKISKIERLIEQVKADEKAKMELLNEILKELKK